MRETFFKSLKNHWIKTGPSILDIAVSRDGINFQKVSGKNGSYDSEGNIKANIDLGDGVENPIDIQGSKAIFLEEKYFVGFPPKNEITIIPLPEIRIPYRAARTDGETVYVSMSKYNTDGLNFKLFVGSSEEELKPVKINKHQLYRDGGSAYFQTELGDLEMPFSDGKKTNWMWAGKQANRIDVKGVSIVETDTGVIFTQKEISELKI